MKIIKYIIKNKINKGIIYSPDSDMILLLGLLNIKNNYVLLRNDNNKNIYETDGKIKYHYNYAYIKEFHNFIIKYLNVKKLDKKRVIKDIIFIFLFGNDFLPKLECLRVNYDIKLFLEIYNFNLKENGYLLNLNNKKFSIIKRNLITFFELLKVQENMLLQRNQFEYKYFNFNRNMVNHFKFDMYDLIKKTKDLTLDNYDKSIIYLRIKQSNDTRQHFGFLKYKILQTLDYNLFTDNILFDTDKDLINKIFIFLINNKDETDKIFIDKHNNVKKNWFYKLITPNDFNSKNNNYHKKFRKT